MKLKADNAAKWLKSNIGIAVLINLFFLLVVILFCDMKYEVSDDFIMASILSGAFGDTQNPQMIFVNIAWGYVLMPFYKLFPAVSWYFVAQIALIFVSSTIISFFLLKNLDYYKAILLDIIFILFFVNDAYILVQFTKTSMLAIMAGGILFVWALVESAPWYQVVIGGLVCLSGTTLRFSDVYIAGGFILLILAYEAVRIIVQWKNGKTNVKNVLKIVVSGLVLIALAFGMDAVDDYTYHNDNAYDFFTAYNSARAKIVDYSDYGYEEYREELEQIGISENDYYMLRSWGFADNDYFNLEKVQQVGKIIVNYQKTKKFSLETLYENIQLREITGYPGFLACVILLMLALFLNPGRWWLQVCSCGIGIFYTFYFSYRCRWVYRIEYAVLAGVFLCGLYFWRKRGVEEECISRTEAGEIFCKKRERQICRYLIVILLISRIPLYIPDNSYKKVDSSERKEYIEEVFYNSGSYDSRKYRKVVNKDKPVNGLLEEIEKNEQNFYFLDFSTTIQTLYYEWGPWETLPTGYFDNVNYMSGVTTNFPDVVTSLEKAGVSNPLRDLVKDNVYLVDNGYIWVKLDYLREHYYPEARAELYKEVDGYQIWKIYEQ